MSVCDSYHISSDCWLWGFARLLQCPNWSIGVLLQFRFIFRFICITGRMSAHDTASKVQSEREEGEGESERECVCVYAITHLLLSGSLSCSSTSEGYTTC